MLRPARGVFNILIFGFITFAILNGGVKARAAFAPAKVFISHSAINARLVPLWIAKEQGFFSKYGIDAEILLVTSGPTVTAALISDSIQVGFGGGSSVLAAALHGVDLKVVATFSHRVVDDLVVRPEIKSPQDLRGKRFGVTSIGGAGWMAAMLGLERLGLDERKDNIRVVAAGGQSGRSQALEVGTLDATTLDAVFSHKLKQKGFPILEEFHRFNIPIMLQGVVVTGTFIQKHGDTLENTLKAMIEGLVYVLSPLNKNTVLNTIMRRLRISDPADAEGGYRDLIDRKGLASKPYPSLEGMRNIQRLMKLHNSQIERVKLGNLIDNRIIAKLDEDGFIDRLYRSYGGK